MLLVLFLFFFFCFYRTSVQSSTGFTPFFLMHFREVKLPIHIKMERATGEGPEEQNESKITQVLINLQDEYRTRAAYNIARGQERQKQQYDKKHNTNTTLKIGTKS